MLTKVKSCAIFGLEGAIIEVEVDISPGLPAFNIVGLPDAAVQEARERVRAAIRNSGCEFPMRRITVNLAPADMKKEGPSYDLPIAVGILTSSGQLEEQANSALYLGELSLDGSTRHTKGVLPMVAMAKDEGFAQVFLPAENAREGSLVEGITVMPVSSLAELVSHLTGDSAIEPCPTDKLLLAKESFASWGPDISHVKGQENAKRALRGGRRGDAQPDDDGAAGQRQDPSRQDHAIGAAGHGLRKRRWRPPRSTASPACFLQTNPSSGRGPSDLLITPRPTRAWWAAGGRPGRERLPWPTGESCSWTNCRSSDTMPWSLCGSPWKTTW